MEEQLVLLANLAKEKGFTTHTASTSFTYKYLLEGKNMIINETCIYLWMCELQKWLREIHDLIIEPIYNSTYNYFDLIVCKVGGLSYHTKAHPSYEQALKFGLKEGLKLI